MPPIEDAERALELAGEAFGRLDVEAAVAHLSAAVRGFTAAGEQRRAAMACAQLGDVLANGMGNLTAGRAWFGRAERLVADEPPCIEQGWVAVAAMGCDVGDPALLLERADLALDRARRFGDVNLETKALADGGLALVQAGRVVEGMARLDEAMALACGPADDLGTSGKAACSFFTACYYAADFDRAASWSDLLRRSGVIATGGTMDASYVNSHCETVRATLLCELGQWSEAEAVLTQAIAEMEADTGIPAWHPAILLADLRIRQGRLTDAEALLLGKDQAYEALLPFARLHLARGDHDLARAAARRGLRTLGDDRLRAVELLTVLVDVELASGSLDAAADALDELRRRAEAVDVPSIRARAGAADARLLAATGDGAGAVAALEAAVDRLGPQTPWLRATLLLDLARQRQRLGDDAGATVDAGNAAAILERLDVVLAAPHAHLLAHPADGPAAAGPASAPSASLRRDGRWWTVTSGTRSARLPDTKGMRYLAELVAHPGVERHALDLVDRAEGVAADGGVDRRALGDAGPLLDGAARTAYRHRIEELRAEIDDAAAAGHDDRAAALTEELDLLVLQLSQAFGLGGRDRRAASAAERARLNVTRALRAAITKLSEALPDAGATLDRGVRTGTYCAFCPPDDADGWIVQS